MKQHVLKIAIDSTGWDQKVPQFMMPLKSVDNKNFCFNDKNVLFNIAERLKQ
jgi:hypothetical protein